MKKILFLGCTLSYLAIVSCSDNNSLTSENNLIERQNSKVFPDPDDIKAGEIDNLENFVYLINRYDEERRKKRIILGMDGDIFREDSKNVSFTLKEVMSLLVANEYASLQDSVYVLDTNKLSKSYLTIHLGMHKKNQLLNPLNLETNNNSKYGGGKQTTTVISTSRNGINYEFEKLKKIYDRILLLKSTSIVSSQALAKSEYDSLVVELNKIKPDTYAMDFGHLSPPN